MLYLYQTELNLVQSSAQQSMDKYDLHLRRMRTHFGDHGSSVARPRSWNSLSPALNVAKSTDSFKTGLNTYLFSNA